MAAIQRVREGERVVSVARDLDFDKRLIYRWMAKAESANAEEPEVSRGGPPRNRQTMQRSLRPSAEREYADAVVQENQRLKQALAEKSLEVDFFKGALQKVEARRQRTGKAGETPSTHRSRK
jgi:hypothetical protein